MVTCESIMLHVEILLKSYNTYVALENSSIILKLPQSLRACKGKPQCKCCTLVDLGVKRHRAFELVNNFLNEV